MRLSENWATTRGKSFDHFDGREGFAQLSHYTARYRDWGDGPPLVLLPGMAGGIELIAPLARKLAYHFRVIAYQLRGEDDPFALRRRFGLRDLVADLHEFLDWHGLERPDLAGVSFGGVLAMEAAATQSSRFRSVSVHGVGARFEGGLIKSIAGLVLSDFPLPSRNPFVNQFFQLLLGRGPQPRELIDQVARLCWQTDQSVMTHRFRMIRRVNFEGRLDRVRVPVLAMTAERDVLVSPSSISTLCRSLPQVKCVRLPRGGHLSFVLDPIGAAREMIHFSEGIA